MDHNAVGRQQLAKAVSPFDNDDMAYGGRVRRALPAVERLLFDDIKDLIHAQPVYLAGKGLSIGSQPVTVRVKQAHVFCRRRIFVDQGKCRAGDARLHAQSPGQALRKSRLACAQLAHKTDHGASGPRTTERPPQQFAEFIRFQWGGG